MNEVIRLENVVKMYPQKRRAVNGVSISAQKKDFIRIYGAPGSGKTTLMRLIAGMEPVSDGTVFVLDKPMHSLDADALANFRNRTFGVMQRVPGFIETLSVQDNIALPLLLRRVPTEQREVAAVEWLKTLGISQLSNAMPEHLSPYESQLVSMARALITDPQILLLDEITANLTVHESEQIIGILNALWETGNYTILCFTADASNAACVIRRFIIEHGKLREEIS